VQYTFGWQAIAPETVRPDHWQSLFDNLVRDKQHLGLPQWLQQNKQAYAQALERLIQAQRLGYWKPDTATREQLAATYRTLTKDAPLHQELTGVRQWAADQLPTAVRELARPQPQAAAPEPVAPPPTRGLLLERQTPPPPPATPRADRLSQALAWVAMALLMSLGAAWQQRRTSHNARAPA
jgi:cobaltochelatase CobN